MLKENVSHHAHSEQEKKLFPLVRKSMNEDERAARGNEVLAMFEERIPAHPSAHLMEETRAAAPLPPIS